MISDMTTQVWDGLYDEEERLPEMLAQKEELLESAGIKVCCCCSGVDFDHHVICMSVAMLLSYRKSF